MKRIFLSSAAALAIAHMLSASPVHAATCGGEPWTVSAFLSGTCAGAGVKNEPGDNSEHVNGVTESKPTPTEPTEPTTPTEPETPGTEEPTEPTEPGTENPGDNGGDNGGEDGGGEQPGDNGGNDDGGEQGGEGQTDAQ